jgi:hypothetical protein
VNQLSLFTLETYKNHELSLNPRDYFYRPLFLYDAGDTVLEPIPNTETWCETITFPGGSHRFEHMKEAISKISAYLGAISFVTDLNM